jgi:hypothetical protein
MRRFSPATAKGSLKRPAQPLRGASNQQVMHRHVGRPLGAAGLVAETGLSLCRKGAAGTRAQCRKGTASGRLAGATGEETGASITVPQGIVARNTPGAARMFAGAGGAFWLTTLMSGRRWRR